MSSQDTTCAICLQETSNHNRSLLSCCALGCRAQFHVECVARALESSASCPVCRRPDVRAMDPQLFLLKEIYRLREEHMEHQALCFQTVETLRSHWADFLESFWMSLSPTTHSSEFRENQISSNFARARTGGNVNPDDAAGRAWTETRAINAALDHVQQSLQETTDISVARAIQQERNERLASEEKQRAAVLELAGRTHEALLRYDTFLAGIEHKKRATPGVCNFNIFS